MDKKAQKVLGDAKKIGWMSEYGMKLQFDREGIAFCEESNEKYILENNQVKKA